MKKYLKYKSTGIDGIGDVPEHWEIIKLKYIAKICNGQDQKDVLDENGNYPIYGSGGIFGYANKFLFEGPSVLLGRKGTVDKPRLVIDPFWTVDTAYYTKISKKVTPAIFYHLCKQIRFDYYIYGSAVPSMTARDLNEIRFALPTLIEQNQIDSFLDYKTAQIDSFIANRQKQIELLKEQLHFKINEAITKGINSKVNYKPTDILYVPEIPEHWEIRKFKGLTTILTCGVAATPEYVEEDEGVAFLSAQNCRPFAMDLAKYSYIKPALHKQLTRYKKPQRGDVLVTRVGAGIGQACMVDIDLEFSVYVSLTHIRPNKEILSEYIVCFFNTEYCYQLNHEGTVVAGGQGNLNVKNVERYRIPLPPIDEQREIITYLDNYRKEMDNLISKYQKQIELMQEYRTSLISQAVTGKIDVRDWKQKNKRI